jgi:hypothetical protein
MRHIYEELPMRSHMDVLLNIGNRGVSRTDRPIPAESPRALARQTPSCRQQAQQD